MTDHDALLDRLRLAALAADPPPPELEGSARAAFGMSRLDEELATLLHDSEQESVAVRGDGDEPHLLSFGSDDVGTDLEITATADGHDVTGTVHGPVRKVTVQTPEEGRDVDLDAHGRYGSRAVHRCGGAGADGDRVRRHGRDAVGPARLSSRAGPWTSDELRSALAYGVGDRVRAVAQLEPRGEGLDRVLDGPLRVAELASDLAGRAAVGEQSEHLQLALGEAAERV